MSRVNALLNRVRMITALTAQKLKKELQRIESEKERLTADLDAAASRIREALQGLGHHSNGKDTHRAPRTAKRKRIRRRPAQLKQEAEAIIQLIKAKGADGAKGGEIRKLHPKVGPDIKGFVRKFSGQKLKTSGAKASMRYFAR